MPAVEHVIMISGVHAIKRKGMPLVMRTVPHALRQACHQADMMA